MNLQNKLSDIEKKTNKEKKKSRQIYVYISSERTKKNKKEEENKRNISLNLKEEREKYNRKVFRKLKQESGYIFEEQGQ